MRRRISLWPCRFGMMGRLSIAGLALVANAVPAVAGFPERTITLVVPFAPGGSTDTIARIVAEQMARTLGQSIVIENDAGAGGTTPTTRVARAVPDGYTIMIGHMGTHGAAPAQYPNLKYHPAKDFTPIGLTAGLPIVIVTRTDFPASNLTEFVDYVRNNQGKVNEGRQNRDLYDRLKEDIEKSKATYDKRYGSTPASSANYFNDEIVRVLADNDAALMGGNFNR